ncbi:hypothetical protein [Agromyces seonyuensis]|uniref:Uncharacterized protein n=1 Tax=Agromyces seonyuensis TaxID=2662446 RepID=A0A6I4P3I6_9MICO|nr:hypothetical protein [Agromyces seonyuensis]MWC00263.1 hypothetical protein [Agromyces seonyuensis]
MDVRRRSRRRLALALAPLAVAATAALTSCSAGTGEAQYLDVAAASGDQRIAVGSLTCNVIGAIPTYTAKAAESDDPVLTATVATELEEYIVRVPLEGGLLFVGTEPFDADDAGIAFESYAGEILESSDGHDGDVVDDAATLDGSLACG